MMYITPTLDKFGITKKDIEGVRSKQRQQRVKRSLTKQRILDLISVMDLEADFGKWEELAIECEMDEVYVEKLFFEIKRKMSEPE